jgi:hypothetical protein
VHTQWVPATVVDVCRSQGTAKYIELAGEGGIVEAFNNHERVADYLFKDLILCAKDIYDKRPSEYGAKEFVFIGTTSSSQKYLCVPTKVNEAALDQHGRIDLNSNENYFEFETQSK